MRWRWMAAIWLNDRNIFEGFCPSMTHEELAITPGPITCCHTGSTATGLACSDRCHTYDYLIGSEYADPSFSSGSCK
jgi:hypothetical protein